MSKTKSIISVIVGNALEFYDSALVMVYATILAKTFFPASDSVIKDFYTGMGVFALGVVIRPLGGLLFGYLGDKHGRKHALATSMVLMAFPSLILALMPGYDVIGLIAPISLVVARIIQGLCNGGEYNGAAIYALENTQHSQGFISGLMTASSVLGFVLALCAQFILSYTPYTEYNWRIAFLLGTCVAIFGIYTRTQLLESAEFLKSKTQYTSPLRQIWKHCKQEMLLVFFIAGQTSVLGYFLLAVAPGLLRQNPHISKSLIPLLGLIGALVFSFGCIVFGKISDHLEHKYKFIVLSSLLSLGILPYGLFAYKKLNILWIFGAQIMLGLLCGLQGSVQHFLYQMLFKPNLRYSAISVGFSLGTGVLAVLTPIWCFQKSYPWLFLITYTSLTGVFVHNYYKKHHPFSTLTKLT